MTVRTRPALDTLPAYAPGRTVPGAVKLASNELSYPALPQVIEAITASVTDTSETSVAGINRYPDNAAVGLTQALAGLLQVPAQHLVTGCGSVSLCQQIVLATAGEGDEVLFGWRSFEAYPIVTRIAGATPVQVQVTADHALDLGAMADAITERTRLVFVCTPNNPTGTTVSAADLDAFLDRVPQDVLVVVDEAYLEFSTATDAPDGARLAMERGNVVALRTLSKAYGLAGLRVGYAVGEPAVIEAIKKVAVPFALNSVAQAAAVAALGAVDDLRPRWQEVIAERGRVTDALRGAGFEVPSSQANFVWLPLREESTAFAAHCEEHRVIVRSFPQPEVGGVRVTIGAPRENDAFLAAATTWRRGS